MIPSHLHEARRRTAENQRQRKSWEMTEEDIKDWHIAKHQEGYIPSHLHQSWFTLKLQKTKTERKSPKTSRGKENTYSRENTKERESTSQISSQTMQAKRMDWKASSLETVSSEVSYLKTKRKHFPQQTKIRNVLPGEPILLRNAKEILQRESKWFLEHKLRSA